MLSQRRGVLFPSDRQAVTPKNNQTRRSSSKELSEHSHVAFCFY